MPPTPPHPDTFVAHGDRRPDDDSAVAPPIHQSATFRAASDAEFDAMSETPRHERYYTRDGNPTFSRVERLIAGLEGAAAAVLSASGMGAISSAILTLVSAGDHIVAQKSHYMGTSQLLGDLLPRFGVSVTLVDQTDTSAFAAWLLLRGLRTLPIRLERQNRTALALAHWLAAHPAVSAVHYPGLPGHPQHDLARRQMPGGFGGLMSVELRGGLPAVQKFLGCMSLPSRAVSFGGFESLATQPAGMWRGAGAQGAVAEAGIGPGLIRFSVGLEHADDLRADLERALAGLAASA